MTESILITVHVLIVGSLQHHFLWELSIIVNQEDSGPTDNYFNDVLWDEFGCPSGNCCDNPIQPWLFRDLSETNTSDIEA